MMAFSRLSKRSKPQTRDMVCRSVTVRAETINEDQRSVEAVLSTETQATVFDWQRYEPIEEILVARGAQFDRQVPFLENHNRFSVDDVLGSVREIRIEGNQVVGRLYFASGDERAERAWNKVRQGHLTDVSIGYRAEKFVDIEPNTTKSVGGTTYKAGARRLRVTTSYRIREGSLVPIGADQAAKIRSDAGLAPFQESDRMNEQLRKYLESIGLRAEATNEEAAAFRDALGGDIRKRADAIEAGREVFPPVAAPANPEQTRSATPPRIAPETLDADAIRNAERAAERTRINAIRALATAETPNELIERAINENMTPDQTATLILRHEREQLQTRTAPFAVHSRSHERDCTQQALAAGLMLRVGTRVIDPSAPESVRAEQQRAAEMGERYRDISLVDLCREACRISQARDPMSGAEPFGRDSWIRAGVSTPSLSYVFTTSVNARLLAAYEEYPDTTAGWVREADVPDFKTNDRIALGKIGGLEKHKRGGTATHTGFTDSKESYKIARYSRQLVIDEQDIIDDALGAFTDQPMEMGMAAARLRPDLVYALLLANGVLSDNVALFHSTHANYDATGALNTTNLKAGVTKMGKQTETDADGKTVNLNLVPRYLIVPQDLQFTAKELLQSSNIIIAGTAGSVTERGNANTLTDLNLQLRVDNRIGVAGVTDPNTGTAYAGTAANWFLSADPISGRTIEVGYLAGGGRRPQLRRFVLDRGQWGVGFDIKMDIGAKALGAKGLYKSLGA